MSEAGSIYVHNINSIVDVRAEASRLLKKAKRTLESGQELGPVAFIVKPDGTVSAMTRNTEPGLNKELSHHLVVQVAHQAKAAAVILITDVWCKRLNVNQREEFLRNYRNGDLNSAASGDKSEALMIHVYGPFGQYALISFYHRAAGGKIIVWDEEIDTTNTPDSQLMTSLLSPWWDESQQPKAS